jgi:hypothetical protein
MNAKGILFSATAATSFMTAFSYLLSESQKKNYREPELLATLLENRWPDLQRQQALPASWATHYALGIIWAIAHELILENTPLKPNTSSSLLLGAFGGLTGIVIWGMLFKSNPQPPKIHYRSFYRQLVLAQLIFSATVVILHKDK